MGLDRMAPRVLIAESDHAISMLLAHHLEQAGFAVDAVARGDEVLARISKNPPHALVLNSALPGVSGEELGRRVKLDGSTAHIVVIMLTASGEDVASCRGSAASADDFIAKPFSVREFTERLRSLIHHGDPARGIDKLVVDDIVLLRSAYVAKRGDRELQIGLTKYKLLAFFMEGRKQD